MPAFSVNKAGTNQTVVASQLTKLTWSTEQFDTNNNFASDKFMPTIAGKYLIVEQVRCITTTQCQALIYKNGSIYTQSSHEGLTGTPSPVANSVAIIDMNGSTDYVEAYVYNSDGTSIDGTATRTFFNGTLIAPGNGAAGGGGSSATTLSALTDVSASSPSSGMLLRYNGSKWEAVGASTAMSTTTMVPGFPDAIMCFDGTQNLFLNVQTYVPTSNAIVYEAPLSAIGGTRYYILYNLSGAYSTNSNMGSFDCVTSTYTLSQLYSLGRAFNFIGNGGSGGNSSGDRIVSGTVSAIAEQTSGTVRVSGTLALSNTGNETCDAAHAYSLRINPTTKMLQMCRP